MNNRDLHNIKRQAQQGSMYVGAGSVITNGELIEVIDELLRLRAKHDVVNTDTEMKGGRGESPEPLKGGEVVPPCQ